MSTWVAPSEEQLELLRSWFAGPPVFTKELLQEWLHYALEFNCDISYRARIKTKDAYKKEYELWVLGPKMVILPSYQKWILQNSHFLPKECTPCDIGFEGMLVQVTNMPLVEGEQHPERCCKFQGNIEFFEEMRLNWKSSIVCQALLQHIRNNAHRMHTVNEVICFGLGPLKLSDGLENHIVRSFLQHAAAMEIRDVLEELQPDRQRPDWVLDQKNIHICVQDPEYCGHCKLILSRKYNLFVLDTPRAFQYVTGNSFVISKAPSAAVRQIVADLTYVDDGPDDGPAGMLCDPILDDGMEVAFGQWADPSSPRLWAYQERNKDLTLKIDDTEHTIEFHGETLSYTVFDEAVMYLKKKELSNLPPTSSEA